MTRSSSTVSSSHSEPIDDKTRRLLVVDDETPARRRLSAMIDALEASYQVVAEAADGETALTLSRDCEVDIVLLDIRMPGMDGLQVAKHLAEQPRPPAVIFCTAYDEHALAAFDAQAVGYLLKPVGRAALAQALANASKVNRAQMANIDASLAGEAAPSGDAVEKRCISAKTHQGYRLVPIQEIRAFVADNKYVSAYHASGELLLDQSLKELEQEFESLFVRVHRNALVAKDAILALEKSNDGEAAAEQWRLRLADVEVMPAVSRRHAADIRRLIKTL